MPDQNSAADEHALMQEITAPLTTLPDDPVPVAADVDFPIVLRGYDRLAVDAYVKKTSQLVAELQATRSPDAVVRRALERVGEQISGILKRAHQTAGEITSQSRREAEDRLEVARQEATGIVSSAQSRVKELDGDTDRIWVERQRIVDDIRGLSEELLALSQAASERFPPSDESSASPEGGAGRGGAAESEGFAEPHDDAAESEDAVEPHDDAAESEHAGEPHDEQTGSESTAVLPTIGELEVEPPPVFGDEPDRPR
jgi:cell division septum initiation protein DivIVA